MEKIFEREGFFLFNLFCGLMQEALFCQCIKVIDCLSDGQIFSAVAFDRGDLLVDIASDIEVAGAALVDGVLQISRHGAEPEVLHSVLQ